MKDRDAVHACRMTVLKRRPPSGYGKYVNQLLPQGDSNHSTDLGRPVQCAYRLPAGRTAAIASLRTDVVRRGGASKEDGTTEARPCSAI